MATQIDPRQRILDAAAKLLAESTDPERITVRQIASRARVGAGLVNYHFRSKDALVAEALGRLMAIESGLDGGPAAREGQAPSAAERVREIMKQTTRVAIRFPRLGRMVARLALLGGDYGPERAIIPLLREHFGAALSEPEIRVTALQIVAPLQAMAVRAEDFQVFAGIDVFDDANSSAVIDRLVDNVLKNPYGERGVK